MPKPWKSRASASAVALLLLAGCTGSDNPAEGNLFDGIANLADGGYQKRLDEREAKLDAAEQRQTALQGDAAAAEQRRDQAGASLAAAEAQLASLDGDLRSLSEALLKAEETGRLRQAEHDALKEDIEDLEAQLALLRSNPVLPPAEKQAEAARLKEELRHLEESLAEALAE